MLLSSIEIAEESSVTAKIAMEVNPTSDWSGSSMLSSPAAHLTVGMAQTKKKTWALVENNRI